MNAFSTSLPMPALPAQSIEIDSPQWPIGDTLGLSHTAYEAASPKSQTVALSSLAQQLSEAAIRATERDSNLSRQELAKKAKLLNDVICGGGYYEKKKIHDAEVPDTNDPLHLARAQQATAFSNLAGSNPFKGMSRDQLSVIQYDESGTFTVNERRAAWAEADDQDEVQKRKIIAKMESEYNRTGKIANSLADLLEFYKSLPAIDHAFQLPIEYEAQLQARIMAGGKIQSVDDFSSWSGKWLKMI